MKKSGLNFPAGLVLFSLSVLLLLPISAMAEGDGAWTTTASPGYIFLIEEDLYNNQNHLVMTVLEPDFVGAGVYWGPASVSGDNNYVLQPLSADSDMVVTWQFNSVTQATVTVESCTTNCLWQPGQVVTLNKFFGDTGESNGGCTCSGTLYANRWCDNGNGTVTDLSTCLVWLKKADWGGAKKWRCFDDDPDPYDDAHQRAGLLYAGATDANLSDGSVAGDWRLPTKTELVGLMSGNAPVWCYTGPCDLNGFTGVAGGDKEYWSSSTAATDTGSAWVMSPSYSYQGFSAKSHSYGVSYVWPVRSGH